MNHKKSKQRERILEVLRGTKSHPSADWVYQKLKPEMPNLSLGTVYRNLSLLSEQGTILRLPVGDGIDRFDGDITPHYHLVCQGCGAVEDLEKFTVEDIDDRAQKMTEFKISGHHLDFFGYCKSCQTKLINQKE